VIRIDLDYWYTFGRTMSSLEECFGTTPCEISARDWSRIDTAVQWLTPIAGGKNAMIPGTKRIANDLLVVLVKFLSEHPDGGHVRVDLSTQARVHSHLTAFHNIARSGSQDIYTFIISGRGAYSAKALLDDATTHLSDLARESLTPSEVEDFQLAGRCYAVGLATATGFHAMRALESEARRYHKTVTGIPKEIEWTLDPLINGNSGQNKVGLRDKWKEEGSRPESPLLLIINLLSSLAQIYRNPIMHPDMTLGLDEAKTVFDTSALVISNMIKDRRNREESGKQ
jgi:hypothetical protein